MARMAAKRLFERPAIIERRAVLVEIEAIPGRQRLQREIVAALLAEEFEKLIDQKGRRDHRRASVVLEPVFLEDLRTAAEHRGAVDQRHAIALRRKPQSRGDAAKSCTDHNGSVSEPGRNAVACLCDDLIHDLPFLFLRLDAFDNDDFTGGGWEAMRAGCLIFFRVVAIERRLIRGKFDNNVTAARLSLSRRERPAPSEVLRAILLECRGCAGCVCLVLSRGR